MSLSRPNQWHRSHADLIWPDRKVRLFLLHVKCRKETMKRQQNSKHETGCILSEKKWKLYILRRQNIYIF